MRRTVARRRASLLAGFALAVAAASATAATEAGDPSGGVEHFTTSADTGGTRHRARRAPATAPSPTAPPAAPIAAAPAQPVAAPTPAKVAASSRASQDARAAKARDGATVRRRPALDGQILARLAGGTSVEVETELRNDEDTWWYVSTPTVSGWIAARELTVN